MDGTGNVEPALAAALIKATTRVPKLTKGKTVKTGTFSYNYCDLATMIDTIRPVFAEEGIAIVFRSWCGDVATMMSCALIHGETGAVLEAVLPISLPEDPKQAGSKITYWKRYLLGLVTGITAEEDDDGHAAGGGGGKRHRNTAARAPQNAERAVSVTGTEPEAAPASNGNGLSTKQKAVRYVKGELDVRFGQEAYAQRGAVLKDLFGDGSWAAFTALDGPVIGDALSPGAHPALKGKSRFQVVCDLVLEGMRRPEDCEPWAWPQKHLAGAVGAAEEGA